MKDRRIAILEGAKAAAKLHHKFGSRPYIDNHRGNVDVFGTIVKEHIPLMFRPLDGLLGLYLPDPGILVTTQRGLSIQRWTAAHELGHATIHHEASLDDEVCSHASHPPPRHTSPWKLLPILLRRTSFFPNGSLLPRLRATSGRKKICLIRWLYTNFRFGLVQVIKGPGWPLNDIGSLTVRH